ncbi:unnamed protein product [Brugia pahangi]|uniref:Secreted protein n=1 Tax=Brugia pahangi TaxID=6280 RepID=A0A0N4TZU1_BRUPA|nr:unnamed protein product [Brugia pahangi]
MENLFTTSIILWSFSVRSKRHGRESGASGAGKQLTALLNPQSDDKNAERGDRKRPYALAYFHKHFQR